MGPGLIGFCPRVVGDIKGEFSVEFMRRVGFPDFFSPNLTERVRLRRLWERRKWERESELIERAARERRAALGATRVHGRLDDGDIREIAAARADLMSEKLAHRHDAETDLAGWMMWLCAEVEALQARPFVLVDGDLSPEQQARGWANRARCAAWWRRQLRRAAVRHREHVAHVAGDVHQAAGQVYVTHDTAHRHQQRQAATAALLERTELESEAGDVMTLAELAATTTANPAIRRGELMTRIVGCERLASSLGMFGVFFTLTAPSRFHRRLREGGADNAPAVASIAAGEDVGPRAAQAWLCAAWGRARAWLQRKGIKVFGFRVAEPHHDGCPHWHALLWVPEHQREALIDGVRAAWLKLSGDEPGAQAHRVKAKAMHEGAAAGYIAKYIAKNIDDAGVVGSEGHRDEAPYSGEGASEPAQPELFGGTAARVRAWASAHGIRQFQAIGQPPVTVWRELRRCDRTADACGSEALAYALAAVSRDGERRADWRAYMEAQGGVCVGRRYRIRLAFEAAEHVGRYETTMQERPVGVFDVHGVQPGQGASCPAIASAGGCAASGAIPPLGPVSITVRSGHRPV